MRCILCVPMNLLMRPYRKISAYLSSLPYHAKAFRLVAKIGPVAWLALLPIAGNVCTLCMLDAVNNPTYRALLFSLGFLTCMWLSLCWIVVPDPGNPGVLCNLKPGRVLSAHLEGEMSGINLTKGAASAMSLAREIGADCIELYSPLFGRPEKERVWRAWLESELARLAPGAVVEVAHRKPLNWFVSFAYRCQYGDNARASFKDGKVQAACFAIRGF